MELETIYTILAVIVLLIGIALALFGKSVWSGLLTSFGSILGWMIGFAVGAYFFGFDTFFGIIITIILAFLGSFIMGALFKLLVEVALALLSGLLMGILAFFLTESIIIAVIVLAVGFILSFIFLEKIVILVTALIGSILAGAATWYLLDKNINYGAMAFLGLLVLGILIQHFLLEDHDNIFDG